MILFSKPVAAPLLVISLIGNDAPLPLATAAVLATDAVAENGPRLGWLDVDLSQVGLRNFALEEAEGRGDTGGRAPADDEGAGGETKVELKEGDAKSDKNTSGKAVNSGKSEKSDESSESENSGSGSEREELIANMRDDNELKKHFRIIGGREAPEDGYSFTVALSMNGRGNFCGGSLIAKDVVLSAAHCPTDGWVVDSVIIGRHDLRVNDGEEIKVRKVLRHPSYNDVTTDNDFMLVFLEEPTTQDVDIIKVNADPAKPRVYETCTVMGWGDTNDWHSDIYNPSDVLLEVDVNAISNDQCERSEGYYGDYKDLITENMLCAKGDMQGDSCQGDSGGPLIVDDGGGDFLQVGVVSWGFVCGGWNLPGVYARLSRAYDWIEREVCRGSDYAEEAGFNCPAWKEYAWTQCGKDCRSLGPGWEKDLRYPYGNVCGVFPVQKNWKCLKWRELKGPNSNTD